MKEKNDDGRGAARIILRAVFPVLAAAGIAGYFIYLKATGREITVANIVEHAPKSALPAAAVLLVLYVIKSLSVVFRCSSRSRCFTPSEGICWDPSSGAS